MPNAAGDRQKASEYYGKLVNLAKNADTERPETGEAKASSLASKPILFDFDKPARTSPLWFQPWLIWRALSSPT
jgi:hypothetical protein